MSSIANSVAEPTMLIALSPVTAAAIASTSCVALAWIRMSCVALTVAFSTNASVVFFSRPNETAGEMLASRSR